MKVRFWCDSGANIHSCREDILDVESELGMTPEEWNALPYEEKQKCAEEWANDRLDIGFEEVEP